MVEDFLVAGTQASSFPNLKLFLAIALNVLSATVLVWLKRVYLYVGVAEYTPRSACAIELQ